LYGKDGEMKRWGDKGERGTRGTRGTRGKNLSFSLQPSAFILSLASNP